MKIISCLFASLFILISCSEREAQTTATESEDKTTNCILLIHGGAGTIDKANMTDEQEKAYRQTLSDVLDSGYHRLKNGETALVVVEFCVKALEDSPLFNAGRGSVYANSGKQEMDAAIMDGKTLQAGAVSGLTRIKNPISLARLVMQESEHVFLSGTGAEEFGFLNGFEETPTSYFHSEHRWKQWQGILIKDSLKHKEDKHGTVGAVALDKNGNLAAATSTGGMTNKKYGRIGDVPLIGAGTYANNQTCAVSATGHGEFFIRAVVAHDISSLIAYKNMTVNQAAEIVVMHKLKQMGGDGGVIVIDKSGNYTMVFNTIGMFRGAITEGVKEVGIWEE